MRCGGRTSSGFTLVELVVTLALLGLVAAMAAPMAEVTVQRQREQDLRLALREIRTAIDQYKNAVDQGLVEKKVGDTGYPPDLETLVVGVMNQKSNGQERLRFLRRVPRDPFNTDLSIAAAASWRLRSSSSSPDSPGPGSDVFDVVSQARGVGLNGIPYSDW